MLLLSRQYFDEAYRIQVDRANPNELSNARHKTVVNANARSAQTDGGAVKAMDCAQPVSMLLLTLTLFYLVCGLRNTPGTCSAADQSFWVATNLGALTWLYCGISTPRLLLVQILCGAAGDPLACLLPIPCHPILEQVVVRSQHSVIES